MPIVRRCASLVLLCMRMLQSASFVYVTGCGVASIEDRALDCAPLALLDCAPSTVLHARLFLLRVSESDLRNSRRPSPALRRSLLARQRPAHLPARPGPSHPSRSSAAEPYPWRYFDLIVNGAGLSPRERLVADICIVGGGPAGITLAMELDARRAEGRPGRIRRHRAAQGCGCAQRRRTTDRAAAPKAWRRSASSGAACSAVLRRSGADVACRSIRSTSRSASTCPRAAGPSPTTKLPPDTRARCSTAKPARRSSTRRRRSRREVPFIEGFDSDEVLTSSLERFSPPTHFGRKYGPALRARADADRADQHRLHRARERCARLGPHGQLPRAGRPLLRGRSQPLRGCSRRPRRLSAARQLAHRARLQPGRRRRHARPLPDEPSRRHDRPAGDRAARARGHLGLRTLARRDLRPATGSRSRLPRNGGTGH